MDLTPTPSQVADARLFRSLTTDQCTVLAPQLSVEQFRQGQVLVHEGSFGYAFYVLRSGSVEARHDLPAARAGAPGDRRRH